MSDEVQPIIIRRKKVYAADGHHGGAWKVAYADFVTAMMAFFLLMWLLNATTEEQRKGIADYFNPNIPLAAVSGGGSGALNGDSVLAQSTLSRNGIGAKQTSNRQGKAEGVGDAVGKAQAETEAKAKLDSLNDALQDKKTRLLEHVSLRQTDEGLVIELIDSDDEPLFNLGNSNPSPLLRELLAVVSESLGPVSNDVKIIGHTDAKVFPNNASYTNWELSSDRANASRRILSGLGFPEAQIQEVSGKGSTEPLVEDVMAPQNRRISIILMHHKAE